jgi:anti-sigma regulatory factor (Ser/Thr protein kinase)
MENRCEYSELTVPGDRSYVPIAEGYVREVSRNMGFDDSDLPSIEKAVSEAVTNAIDHAFEPGERQTVTVSCERISAGMRIVVKDQGIPFHPPQIPDVCLSRDSSHSETGFCIMTRLVDEVSIHNLGPEGKEVHLVKYLKSKTVEDYLEACELGPFIRPSSVRALPSKRLSFQVRLMKPEEAIQVSKLAYRAYGYTYGYEHIYYPDRMAEMNAAGQTVSAVAVTESGELAGHCAIFNIDGEARVAEIGQAVVKPDFRGSGCLASMTDFILKEAESRGLIGIYTRAVTNHVFSQRVSGRFGFKSCGVMLGFAPADVSFREITEKLRQRESFIVEFLYLSRPEKLTLYTPDMHKEVVEKIYRSLGVSPQFGMLPNREIPIPSKPTLKVWAAGTMPAGFAKITIASYGENTVQEVAARLKELCLKHYDVIGLNVTMLDPMSYHMIPEFERLGFFFSGVLPGKEDLMMQYLNNTVMDYSLIKLHSDIGKEILSYIKAQDLGAAR